MNTHSALSRRTTNRNPLLSKKTKTSSIVNISCRKTINKISISDGLQQWIQHDHYTKYKNGNPRENIDMKLTVSSCWTLMAAVAESTTATVSSLSLCELHILSMHFSTFTTIVRCCSSYDQHIKQQTGLMWAYNSHITQWPIQIYAPDIILWQEFSISLWWHEIWTTFEQACRFRNGWGGYVVSEWLQSLVGVLGWELLLEAWDSTSSLIDSISVTSGVSCNRIKHRVNLRRHLWALYTGK